MGRRPREDSRERRHGNSIKWRKNNSRRWEYSGKKSPRSCGRIDKPYRNNGIVTSQTKNRNSGKHKDQRQLSGGQMYTGKDRPAAYSVIERKSEDIRTILAGPQAKDSSDISLILGVNLEKAKFYLKEATENKNRLKRCLQAVDKAFQSETTTASKANLIIAMTETEFVRYTVDTLKQYFESIHSNEENISIIEAVCALLRITICVCVQNPSALAFIYGSFQVIRELVTTIRNSMVNKIDLKSTDINSKRITTTKSTDIENGMETDSACLQSVYIHKNRDAEGDNNSSIIYLRDEIPQTQNWLTKGSNEAEGDDQDSSVICLRDNETSQTQNLLAEKSIFPGETITCLAKLDQLFSDLDENVKSCSSRRKKQMQHEPVKSEGNSDEDFRAIPTFPRLGDLNGDIKSNLRVHKAKGPYSSVDDYLDVQFRLLREDFVEPLREGIRSFTGHAFGKNKRRIQEIKVYENTQILSAFCGDGVNHILTFDISKLRHVKWNMTKRLKYGSLICLSSDNFQTCYFAAIVDSEAKFRRQGRLHVKFEHPLKPNQVQLLVGSSFTMIESTAYFEAYRPVLSSLQIITEDNLPFKEYIIGCKRDVLPPKYLLRSESERTLDLRCLVDPDCRVYSTEHMYSYLEEEIFESYTDFNSDLNRMTEVNILSSKWHIEDQLHLDSSQLSALKTALTREFSVIQGPPGCGKTHLGLKIAKVLLYNKHKWQHENGTRAQMLVVCYTNHALDQFMEGICSFFSGHIVRVGSRCLNETMDIFNCKAIKKRFRKSKVFPDHIELSRDDALRGVDELKQQINLQSEKIKILRENIIHEQSLCDEMGIDHYKQFTWLQKRFEDLPARPKFLGSSSIVEWLGIIEMAKEIRREMYKDNQNKDKDYEIFSDNELHVENREAITEINFDFDKHLNKSEQEKLTKFKTENISLDFDKINILKELKDETKRKNVERERRKLTKRLQHNLRRIKPMSELEAVSINDILRTGFTQDKRWALYLHWVQKKCNKINQSYERKLELYEQADLRLKDVDMMEERFIFKNADIIAMTTTGAAKHKKVLREIKPKIMIVEEAAEVLESHIISNLTSGCEQLIMIGDHKQLKPKPNVYRLETEYNLNLSLFERMIRNGMKFDCLQIQHRMRPEIADNVRPLYGTLLDHESVKRFESINGIVHNMYFIDHCVEERKDEELESFTNKHEVQYLIALCKYLLLQGYNKSDITILTTYKGQMFLMKKGLLEQGDDVNGVRMTIVDNYQGEENEIILLSLVRSNKEGRIGYLARDDRVCVALSRAKKGLYIIGNSTCLSSATDLWKSIINKMRQKGLLGKALQLCCQNHNEDTGIKAENSEDFRGAPEGGCRKRCDIRLDCGHVCERFCHINRQHMRMCEKPCTKKCRNGHVCKRMCWQDCYCEEIIITTLPECGHIIQTLCQDDLQHYICNQICNKRLNCGHDCTRMCQDQCICMEPVSVLLPCGHDEMIPCSINPAKHECTKDVEVLRTDCRHTVTVKCRDVSKHTICKTICNLPLDCGHPCKDICGVIARACERDDNRAISKCPKGHISFCKVPCETKLRCGHACKGLCCTCFQGRWHTLCKESCTCNIICGHKCKGKCGNCLPCIQKCMRKCSHRICRRKCIEECMPCKSKCNWKCEHLNCTKQCGNYCDRQRCNKPCKKLLPCNHKCIGMCGDPCPMFCRICDNKIVTCIHYGAENQLDSRFVQLQDCGHLIRYDIMDVYMDIDEGACLKRCPLCMEPIRFTNGNRYENIVNEIYLKINTCKRLIRRDDVFSCTLMKSALQTHRTQLLDWKFATFCSDAYICYTSSNIFSRSGQPPLFLDFLACRDTVNTLNQLAIFSFLNLKSSSTATDKEVLFRGASFCLSSSQHSYEIEREIKRFLDTRQLEKLRTRRHGCDENREAMENANKVLLKPGLYSEEDRKSVQKCFHMFPKEDIDTELINLSLQSFSFDRDTILKEGYIHLAYGTNFSEGLSFEISEHQPANKQSETLGQIDNNSNTHYQRPVIDSFENNQIKKVHTVDIKLGLNSSENNYSEDALLKPEIKNLKGDIILCSTSSKVFEPVYRPDIVAGNEKKRNISRNILLTDFEDQEEVGLSENEISVIHLSNTAKKTEDTMKGDKCISKEPPCYMQDIEEGEIIDDNDKQDNCLEITKIEIKNNMNEERLKICEEVADRTSMKEETIVCTEHGLYEESAPTHISCSSHKQQNNPKKSLFFGRKSDFSMKTHSNTDTAKSRHSEGQTYVIKQFTWPGVPYFHSEQSVFHLKKIQEPIIQNSVGKGSPVNRNTWNQNEVEQVTKKAKSGTKTITQISALNNKKRLNKDTNETEPANKKKKDDRKGEHDFSPDKTDARKVIITSSKLFCGKNAGYEHTEKPRSPFEVQKISGLISHTDTTSSSRQQVDYGDINMNEDNIPDFEYTSMTERENASFHSNQRTKEQKIHSAQRKEKDLRYLINEKKQLKSKLVTNDATKNNDRLRKHVQAREEEDGKHNYCDTKGKQNTTQEDNRECDSSGMREMAPKSQYDLRHVLNKKDCKQSSESLEADELQIEGDAWKILDTI